MNPNFKEQLLKLTDSFAFQESEVIQSLWSGYGKISRYQLDNSPNKTVVVKHIALNKSSNHPRGWDSTNSHNRKVKSYEIETYWYQHWNHQCTQFSRTPKFLGSYTEGQDQWIILEDLNHKFPFRKYSLSYSGIENCLKWLANFHSTFLNQTPKGLWEVGTYWHLETRPDELEKIENQEIKSKAVAIDHKLNNCKYSTIVHGDAKLANFCFSKNEVAIAAVDFQYVGGGCGMKDVAYFLGSCLSSSDCELYQDELLKFYFKELKLATKTNELDINLFELESEWRSLYPFAFADFTRFLLGWMPTHQKLNGYHLKLMNQVLKEL